MLKLKKIQILGFKSFCDKTELSLPGAGIAAVVGPNGCGKSNILDGVTWVLGEQSAKSLRGGKMEDVIFAGTRDRRSLGMAEVSITLIEPDAYEGPSGREPEEKLTGTPDWDESLSRAAKAEEAEQIIAASQPGQNHDENAEGGDEVVLKVRRRKFHRTAQKGEIIVTRRLFRTGESEYLLNGKLCRLGDIRDIFMGTGLGPESYAIIGQERIGQLLSSKPHDRRAIIEEAAGITRFKTKKRLAELRLEQAKQNLARIDDIFDEIVRQMTTLKRQAAKAERWKALRDEFLTRLRVVLGSKLAAMEEQDGALASEIAALSAQVDEGSGSIETLHAELTEGRQRGYTLDAEAREQSRIAGESAIELERARSRRTSNTERIADLDARAEAARLELGAAREQLATRTEERAEQRAFLDHAMQTVKEAEGEAAGKGADARTAAAAVGQAEARMEATRRETTQLLHGLGQARREQAQAEEALLSLHRDANRLDAELGAARRDLDILGTERGQVTLRFERATETLRRLEAELVAMREDTAQRQAEETTLRRRGDALRSERAHLLGRRNSLESLLREHSYSTDTVKKLLHARTLSGGLQPVGTLADFLEVGEQYESVVDEFLRDELNYIVVKSWDAAEEGMRLLKAGPGGVDGRATFLVHPEDAQAKFSFAADDVSSMARSQGVVRLKDCVRVLDGFGRSLEVILPKLRDGYVAENAETARSLALENPHAFFLAPSGECFHNVTVTGGKPRTEGPLALKRELRDMQGKLAAAEGELASTETQISILSLAIGELTRRTEAQTAQRREAERENAHEGAALRQMQGEQQRLERRLAEYTTQNERARTERGVKETQIVRTREQALELAAAHAGLEARQEELGAAVSAARSARELAQAAAAQASGALAALEERRRGAEANWRTLERTVLEGERRAVQLEQQLASSGTEREQRRAENNVLAAREEQLRTMREAADQQAKVLAEEARAGQTRLLAVEARLRELRSAADAAREQRALRAAAAARLAAELAHLGETSVQELGLESSALRAQLGTGEYERLAPNSLLAEEKACREMKQRLEAMGPVNMMALDELAEAEARHSFLETQRKDLIDSIENTRSTIRELDGISRTKFEEAFARINENFNTVFARLFGGGQASMRLVDEEGTGDAGVDIVAQPPGKKLQNVFLLSGGEKALTALSLLMGIFMHQPAPFCVLDEVDAPLDETNVGRLAETLRSMAEDTQFVMVTHSKRMMTAADVIYGVTMQEPGVSKIVSVRLHGVEGPLRGRGAQRELALA